MLPTSIPILTQQFLVEYSKVYLSVCPILTQPQNPPKQTTLCTDMVCLKMELNMPITIAHFT